MRQVYSRWREFTNGGRAIGFCSSVPAAQAWSEEFRRLGAKSGWVSDVTYQDPQDRAQTLADLETHDREIVFCKDVLTEGFDLAELEGVLLLGPTDSSVRLTQQIGRVTRILGHDIRESRLRGKSHGVEIDAVGATRAGVVLDVDLRDLRAKGAPGEPRERGEIDVLEVSRRTVLGAEPYEIDLFSGLSWICVAGARVMPLNANEAVCLLEEGDEFLCVYAREGDGAFETRFPTLLGAADYAEDHINPTAARWIARREGQHQEEAPRELLDRIDALEAELDLDLGLRRGPSKAYARGIVGYLLTVRERRRAP
jgi:hypothetical protein